jgi:hypothetical protein
MRRVSAVGQFFMAALDVTLRIRTICPHPRSQSMGHGVHLDFGMVREGVGSKVVHRINNYGLKFSVFTKNFSVSAKIRYNQLVDCHN